MTTAWARLTPTLRDGAGAGGLLVLSLLPLGVPGVELGDLHGGSAPSAVVVLTVGQTVPLIGRRRVPAVVLALVGIAFAIAQLTGTDTGLAGLGLFVALYSAAAYEPTRRRLTAIVSVAAYVALAIALHAAGSPERTVDWVTFAFVLATPWLAGLLVRRRLREQAARERAAADRAVSRARALLARDLHDVVTHHVTAMVVQADSAGYLGDDDAAEIERRQTFDTIGSTGRRALQELRALLGALDPDAPVAGSPREPGVGSVAELVRDAVAGGRAVTLAESGPTGDVSHAVAATLYRIAQESLTNALRHSPGAPVAVTVAAHDGRIGLTVENELTGDASGSASGGAGVAGRGRRGMADRAALLGGRFESGPVGGRFRVAVELDALAEPSS